MLTGKPEVTVVLPCYNDTDTIGSVLAALAKQEGAPPMEVIVVDDGSTDGAVVPAPAGRARVIRQPNAGPAAARNRGAREAAGKIILFLDADCVPPPNWVAVMSAAIDGTRFQAVMGTICAANDGIIPRLVQIEVEDRYRGMHAARDGVDFIAAPTCGFLREAFLAVGGFDERLRQAEDVELAYRFTGAGNRIAFVAGVPVAHKHQTGWAEFIRTKYRRAVGRLRVFVLHPRKRRHDTWTPMSLKVQFAAIALAVPFLAASLLTLWPAAIAGLGLLGLGLALGGPLIIATAERERPLAGFLGGLAIGAAFVLIRSLVILAAMLRVQLERVCRPTVHRKAAP